MMNKITPLIWIISLQSRETRTCRIGGTMAILQLPSPCATRHIHDGLGLKRRKELCWGSFLTPTYEARALEQSANRLNAYRLFT